MGRRKVQFPSRFNKSTIVFCTLIDLRNDVRMIKTKWNQKPQQNYCQFFFNNSIDSFDVHLRRSFSENRALEKEKTKLRHHHVISMVCTLIEQRSSPISAREIAQLLKKFAVNSFWTLREYYANFLVKMAISLLLDTELIYAVPLRLLNGRF